MASFPPPKRHPYDQWSPDTRALDLVGDKWTLLIVRDLAAGPRRFVELQRVLPGISTEQLRSRLNRMVADGLLTRQRYREVPPRVDYELTDRAKQLMPVLGALARWGYDWAWSAPRPSEDIDIGAIVRLAPGLVSPPKSLSGSVALEATGKRGAIVTVELDYDPPGGLMGVVAAKLSGEEPYGQLQDDLRRFKQIIEVGEVVLSDATLPGTGLTEQRAAQPAAEANVQ